MPQSSQHIILVDPIFRASRLAYTVYAIRACQGLFAGIHVICREDYHSELFDELTRGLAFELHPVVRLGADFWYGKLPGSALLEVEGAVRSLHSRLPVRAVWFSGLDEFYNAFLQRIDCGGTPDFGGLRLGGVVYDARFLLRRRAYIPGLSRLEAPRRLVAWAAGRPMVSDFVDTWRVIRALAGCGRDLRLAVLDERVLNLWLRRPLLGRWLRGGSFSFFWMPDPCAAYPEVKGVAPSSSGLRLLLVGTQSERKGLADIAQLLVTGGRELEGVRFDILGRLCAETEAFRPLLEQSPLVRFREGFFPEEVVAEAFREADYVVLPYTRAFHGSSGVLAHAAVAGRPLLATEHGLIGYRVRRENLGLVYSSGDVGELRTLLAALPGRDSPEYALWRRNQLRRAAAHTEERCILHFLGGFLRRDRLAKRPC